MKRSPSPLRLLVFVMLVVNVALAATMFFFSGDFYGEFGLCWVVWSYSSSSQIALIAMWATLGRSHWTLRVGLTVWTIFGWSLIERTSYDGLGDYKERWLMTIVLVTVAIGLALRLAGIGLSNTSERSDNGEPRRRPPSITVWHWAFLVSGLAVGIACLTVWQKEYLDGHDLPRDLLGALCMGGVNGLALILVLGRSLFQRRDALVPILGFGGASAALLIFDGVSNTSWFMMVVIVAIPTVVSLFIVRQSGYELIRRQDVEEEDQETQEQEAQVQESLSNEVAQGEAIEGRSDLTRRSKSKPRRKRTKQSRMPLVSLAAISLISISLIVVGGLLTSPKYYGLAPMLAGIFAAGQIGLLAMWVCLGRSYWLLRVYVAVWGVILWSACLEPWFGWGYHQVVVLFPATAIIMTVGVLFLRLLRFDLIQQEGRDDGRLPRLPFQYSIKQMLLWTTGIAVALGGLKALGNNYYFFRGQELEIILIGLISGTWVTLMGMAMLLVALGQRYFKEATVLILLLGLIIAFVPLMIAATFGSGSPEGEDLPIYLLILGSLVLPTIGSLWVIRRQGYFLVRRDGRRGAAVDVPSETPEESLFVEPLEPSE